jgi:GH18 family chitinase
MGLAGIMFWAPDLDDFTGGSCNEGKYPLMNTAINLLHDQKKWVPSTKSSTTSSTTTTIQPTFQEQKRVVCYYTKYVNEIDLSGGKKREFLLAFSWAQYRPDAGKFVPENLDASLCTHIIYAFAVLKDSKLAPFEWNDEDTDWSKGLLNSIISLFFFLR